jgi:hypothetical protein
MKKFISTEEGVWQELTRVTSEDPNVRPDKTPVPASAEDTLKLQEIYIAAKPKLGVASTFSLLSASIKMDDTSKSGSIKARINGNHIVIDIK